MKFNIYALTVSILLCGVSARADAPNKDVENPARVRILYFLSHREFNAQGLDTTPEGFEAVFVANGKSRVIRIPYDAPSAEIRNLEPGAFSIQIQGVDGNVLSSLTDTLKPNSVNLLMLYGPQKSLARYRKIEFNVSGNDNLVRVLNLSSLDVLLKMAGQSVKVAANASEDFQTTEKELEYQIAAFDNNRWRVRQKGFIWRTGEGPCLAVIYPNGVRHWTMAIAYDSNNKAAQDTKSDSEDLNSRTSGVVEP